MLYYSAFIIGLFSSLHCLGMCGPLAFALPVRTNIMWLKGLKYIIYNSGRMVTYACFGMLAGVLGKGFALAGLQQIISIVSGLLLIASVILVLHPGRFLTGITGGISGKVRALFSHYFKNSGWSSMFILGMLNGLLPCGIVYTALLAALASGSMLSGSMFMAAFGLGTFPVMMAVGIFGGIFNLKGKFFFRQLTPFIACIIGVLLIMRGLNLDLPFISPAIYGGTVSKCH